MTGPNIVQITWRDAAFFNDVGWASLEEYQAHFAADKRLVQSVGFLMESTPQYLAVALSYDPGSDAYADVQQIPRGMVVGVAYLEPCEDEG